MVSSNTTIKIFKCLLAPLIQGSSFPLQESFNGNRLAASWLAGLAGWLASWLLAGWLLADCLLTGCLPGWLAGWLLDGWLAAGRLAGCWLDGWTAGRWPAAG